MKNTMKRAVVEPGGVLLIAMGLSARKLAAFSAHYYPQAPSSLTILIEADQQGMAFQSDEIWVFGAGIGNFLALIRRISWRRFDLIICPHAAKNGWLWHFVWPRPPRIKPVLEGKKPRLT